MRKKLLILLALLIGVAAYGYIQNPVACRKLGSDLANDIARIFVPTEVTSKAFGATWSSRGASLLSLVVNGGSTNSSLSTEPAAPTAATATPATVPAPQPAAPAGWTPPSNIPAQPNWTWTTPQGVYHDVKIVKVEADCVTIFDRDGGALVPISELPADLQKQLNYNADAAAAAALQRQKEDSDSARVLAQERSQGTGEATDYNGALAAAKASGKPVLLHFTGSDWCPYCKDLDSEVISSPSFGDFIGANYIFLTLDFPHALPQSDEVKQQNQALARKFGVSGFPTLLVIDSSERELGRLTGYNPGSGPEAVIAELKAFKH